jgi:CubicO group peptidase (beta-lactamase class C family)
MTASAPGAVTPPQRPEVDAAEIDELVRGELDGQTPGAAVAVVRSGVPLFARCFGHADLEWGQPVTPVTVFRLASLTKPLTALAVLLLERDGLVDLDAPVRAYLADYPRHADAVRVRHLLTHTSGIPNFVTLPSFAGSASRADHTDAEVRALFADLPLEFEPGSRYGYSNSGYRLLDMIVSRVSGTSFSRVLAERVFGPAGMADTRLLSDEAIVPRRARGYRPAPDGYANADYVSMTVPGGAGGVGSTLEDLLRLDRALRDGVPADAALQRRMSTPVRLTCGRTEGYGLGWALSTYRGRRLVHHAGGINGFSCIYVRVPEEDASVVVLTNSEAFVCTRLARKLLDAVLRLPATVCPPVILPPDELRARSGSYADNLGAVEVTAEPDALVVRYADRTHRMRPVDPVTYVDADDPDVRLRFHDGEASACCTLSYPVSWLTGYRG